MQDHAVGANIKRPAEWECAICVNHTVCGCNLLVGIAEDRVVQIQRFGKLGVHLVRVTTGGEVGNIELSQSIAALTERLTLGRSATGKRLRIPSDHDNLFAFEIGQLMRRAV